MKNLLLTIAFIFALFLIVNNATSVIKAQGTRNSGVSNTVQGTISSSSDVSVAGLRVKIIETGINRENLLAEVITDANGLYQARFQASSPIDIEVQVYSGQILVASESRFNASRSEIINIEIKAQPENKPSLFRRIVKKVTSTASSVVSGVKLTIQKLVEKVTGGSGSNTESLPDDPRQVVLQILNKFCPSEEELLEALRLAEELGDEDLVSDVEKKQKSLMCRVISPFRSGSESGTVVNECIVPYLKAADNLGQSCRPCYDVMNADTRQPIREGVCEEGTRVMGADECFDWDITSYQPERNCFNIWTDLDLESDNNLEGFGDQ